MLIKNLSELFLPKQRTGEFLNSTEPHTRYVAIESKLLSGTSARALPFMINKFHRSGYFHLGDFSQGEKVYFYQLLLCMYIKRDVCESIKITLDLGR